MRFLFMFCVAVVFSLPTLVVAAGVVPCGGLDCRACDLVSLGQNLLRWFIGIMISIVGFVFAWGGMKMVMSAGNAEQVGSAKQMMSNSIIGLVILLASFLIVDTLLKTVVDGSKLGTWNEIECIPPQPLTPDPVPDAGVGTTQPTPQEACTASGGTWSETTDPKCTGGTPPVAGACPVTGLTPLTDAAALQMEGGATVIWTGADPRLQTCVNKFTKQVGGKVTSAYRPQAYQTHLRDIYNKWCSGKLKDNTDEACIAVRSDVYKEVSKHFGSSWSCGAVSSGTSNHTLGIAVDISGITHSSPTVINAANNSCLTWANHQGDPYHYNLKSGCSCN